MSSGSYEQELAAITAIIKALEELDEDGRKRVLRYVFDHLKLSVAAEKPVRERQFEAAQQSEMQLAIAREDSNRIVDIRSLREEKQPSTDVQMAAIVAYYLAELAPAPLRKDSITVTDVIEYFKQAGHPLPKEAKYTLTNARNSGYLDAAGNGQYRLNPVGHNLVVHKLPRTGNDGQTVKVRTVKKPRKSKGSARKTKKP